MRLSRTRFLNLESNGGFPISTTDVDMFYKLISMEFVMKLGNV